jgi:serine/threonine protein phosphatase PrpC
MASLSWQVAAASDQGCVRQDNQDNYYISPDSRIFVVADGMGGEAGGALASRLAIEAVEELFWERIPDCNDEIAIQEWLVEAVSRANMHVYSVRVTNPDVKRLGTTIVVAAQSDTGSLHVAHLGDSRAYRITSEEICVLTQDHSVAFELLRLGKLTPEQYENSPFRSYLTRCVGHDAQVSIDQSPVRVGAGDWILMCTDGLTGVLQESEIFELVRSSESPEEACQKLISKTLEGGAPDNVTVLCAQYVDKKANVETPEAVAVS